MNTPTTEPEHTRWHRYQEVELKTSQLMSAGYTFTFNEQEYTFDTNADSLNKLAVAYNVAKQYQAAGQPYTQIMVMSDYKTATMDRDSIISIYEAMIAYGLQIYGIHASLIQVLSNLTYEELLEWKDPRV